MPSFYVTYDTVTEESAAIGDTADHGWVAEGGWHCPVGDKPEPMDLRTALDLACVGYAEASSWPDGGPGDWWTFYGEMSPSTGETESRALHAPERITPSSWKRLDRLIKAYS